jgi:periplasmic copper chaperone A
MRKVMIVLVLGLALSACDNSSSKSNVTISDDTVTRIVSEQDVNGVKSKTNLEMTAYAMRSALGQNPNTAAYVTITNKGDTDDALVSVSCECAQKTELHTMKMEGDKMMMATMPDGFVIKAGETVSLKPGGDHIMLLGLTSRPKDGDIQKLLLSFKSGASVTIAAPVSDTPLAK